MVRIETFVSSYFSAALLVGEVARLPLKLLIWVKVSSWQCDKRWPTRCTREKVAQGSEAKVVEAWGYCVVWI